MDKSFIPFLKFFYSQFCRANGSEDLDVDYDVIICADCLFFDEGRPQLLECLKKKLKAGGTAIIVAPSRSGTFEVIFMKLQLLSVYLSSMYLRYRLSFFVQVFLLF